MNPQERSVIDDIFNRLRGAANQPREAEAERYIADQIRAQPYAPYAMAQSLYVQEQALLNQQHQIEELQAQIARLERPQPSAGGFLSGLFGGGGSASSSAPAYGTRHREAPHAPGGYASMPPNNAPQPSPWGGGAPAQQQPQARQGMGFLGTAAATATGIAGGMLLGNMLANAFGGAQEGIQKQISSFTDPNNESAPSEGAPSSFEDNTDFGDFGGGDDSYDV